MNAKDMTQRDERRGAGGFADKIGIAFGVAALAGFAFAPVPALAGDPGKHACFVDAKRLCPKEVAELSKSKAQACMIVHLEQVSPQCHTYMIAERDKAMRAKKTEPSAQ